MKDANKGQRAAVWSVICDGKWRTLNEINQQLDYAYSIPGISARLRDFRKAHYGSFTIERKLVQGSTRLYAYRVLLPQPRHASQAPLFTSSSAAVNAQRA